MTTMQTLKLEENTILWKDKRIMLLENTNDEREITITKCIARMSRSVLKEITFGI